MGDVHGDFATLASGLQEAARRSRPFEFVLAVGDLEANRHEADLDGVVVPARHRSLGDFHRVLTGQLDLGAPRYFIAGNHDPYRPSRPQGRVSGHLTSSGWAAAVSPPSPVWSWRSSQASIRLATPKPPLRDVPIRENTPIGTEAQPTL